MTIPLLIVGTIALIPVVAWFTYWLVRQINRPGYGPYLVCPHCGLTLSLRHRETRVGRLLDRAELRRLACRCRATGEQANRWQRS